MSRGGLATGRYGLFRVQELRRLQRSVGRRASIAERSATGGMADDYRDRGAGGRNPDLMPKRLDYLITDWLGWQASPCSGAATGAYRGNLLQSALCTPTRRPSEAISVQARQAHGARRHGRDAGVCCRHRGARRAFQAPLRGLRTSDHELLHWLPSRRAVSTRALGRGPDDALVSGLRRQAQRALPLLPRSGVVHAATLRGRRPLPSPSHWREQYERGEAR